MEEARWYVVHTYSGYENKVMLDILKTRTNRNLEDQILEVEVPVEEVYEMKGTAEAPVEKPVKRKLFPGYVLVHMVYNNETWYVVRNTRGVTGFVGPESKPTALSEEEIRKLRIGAAAGEDTEPKEKKVVVDFAVGDTVTVISGPWKNTVSKIVDINENKRKVSIMVEMSWGETPVELDFTDIKKM